MASRTNWQALLVEFEDNRDKYSTIKDFATSKQIPYDNTKKGLARAKVKRTKLLSATSGIKGTEKQKKGTKGLKKQREKAEDPDQTKQNIKRNQTTNSFDKDPEPPKTSTSKVKKNQPLHDVHEEKGLNLRQESFVNGILEGKTQKQAAIDAGYAPTNASALGSKLQKHQTISNKIARSREELRKQLRITHKAIAERLALIAFSDMDDMVKFENGKMFLRDDIDNTAMLGVSKIKVKTTKRITETGEDESVEIEVVGVDNAKALGQLEKMLGYTDGITYNSMRSKDKTVRAIWEKFRIGEITAQDAWVYFDAYGIETPQSIMDQAKAEFKYAIEEAEGTGVEGLDYDTLEKRWQKGQEELKRQREKFLPQRERELQEMRKNFEDKNINERKPDKVHSQKTDKEVGKKKPNE